MDSPDQVADFTAQMPLAPEELAIATQIPFGRGTDQRRCKAGAIPVQGQCAQALEAGRTGLEPAVLKSRRLGSLWIVGRRTGIQDHDPVGIEHLH